MSADLRIWQQPQNRPLPTTIEEAGLTMLELERQQPGPNPKFVELARAMRSHFPDDDLWPHGDPVAQAQTCYDAVWAFSLPDEEPTRVVGPLVEAAAALGLVVYGDQIAMAFLPDGRVLPEETAVQWAEFKQHLATAPRPLTKAQVRKLVAGKLWEMLARHGFTPDPNKHDYYSAVFERPLANGLQTIGLSIKGVSPQFSCNIVCYHHSELVNTTLVSALENIDMYKTPYTFFFGAAVFQYAHGETLGFPIENMEKVRAALEVVEKSAIPVLDMATTATGLDRVMNERDLFRFSYAAVHPKRAASLADYFVHQTWGGGGLVAAWLVGNPRLDELANDVRTYYKSQSDVFVAHIERLLEYFRQNPRQPSQLE